MIVQTFSDHYKIIYQRSHALLSAQLFTQCKPLILEKVTNYNETLIAIATHDDGFTNADKKYYINDKGQPKDFRENTFEKEASIQILENARLRSVWSYLMALYHMVHLYQNKNDEAIRMFVAWVNDTIDSVIHKLHIKKEKAEQSYQFLRFTDDLSLFICFHLFDKESGNDTIKTPVDNTCCTVKLYDNELIISPSILKVDSNPMYIEYREIPMQYYNKDKQLHDELIKARVRSKKITLCEKYT